MEIDERILKTLRVMEWEKIKGQLQAMLQTFYSKYPEGHAEYDSTFDVLLNEIDKFICNVDDLIW
jgi:hypothetical protein